MRVTGIFYVQLYIQYGKSYNKLKKQEEYYGLYRKGKRSRLRYKRCRDCGKMFFANSKDNQTTRCKECYDKYRRKYKTQKDIERYHKNKISDSTN